MDMHETHDGKELEMLLNGSKPLAAFCVPKGQDESVHFFGQEFNAAVEAGRLERHEFMTMFDEHELTNVLFATPEESWRLKAYQMLIEFLHRRTWSKELEWLQGTLLGYTDAENRTNLIVKYNLK